MITLDILSDPVCPWCLIGATRLMRALESRPGHLFALAWHPFMLNPDMPPGGMDRRAYLEAKFGGREGAVRAYLPVQEAAAEDGLDLRLDAVRRMPSSLDAHRLIHWAGLEGRQTPVALALMDAFFRRGADIGAHDVLVDVAGRAGMDRAVTARLLAGDADSEDVRARDRHARERGVTGVPTFVIAERSVIVGAQPVKTWQGIIDEIAALPGPGA
jgi:predicted DsbA family dithiol-disulfide isomerase